MKYHLFQDQTTEQLFKQNHLAEFEQLWDLDCEWFEEPNYRRNGWSGVSKYPLKDKQGGILQVFIKRQENHNSRTLLHPVSGVPTFRSEFFNIQRLNKKNIPSLTALYYGERIIQGKAQSILVTVSLEDYQNFEEFFQNFLQTGAEPPQDVINNVMQTAGQTIRKLHEANYRHGSLYLKHFFVKIDNGAVDIRLIDLEKLNWYPFKYLVRYSDISRFIQRRAPIKNQAMETFINSYLNYGKDLSQSALARQLKQLLNRS